MQKTACSRASESWQKEHERETRRAGSGAGWARRFVAAAEIVLAEHPEWARAGMRFDLMVVDAAGTVRRIADAFRWEN